MKRHIVPGLLLGLFAIVVGCSHQPTYTVFKMYDEFDDFTTFDLKSNFLGGNKGDEVVQLNISEHIDSNRKVSYALYLIYYSHGPHAPHRKVLRWNVIKVLQPFPI